MALCLYATRRAAVAWQLHACVERVLKAAQPFLALFEWETACHNCTSAGQIVLQQWLRARSTARKRAMSLSKYPPA